jgi:hypothetical protein
VSLGVLRDAGIAGCDMHLVHLPVTSQRPDEGMLAGTGAHNQDDHKR